MKKTLKVNFGLYVREMKKCKVSPGVGITTIKRVFGGYLLGRTGRSLHVIQNRCRGRVNHAPDVMWQRYKSKVFNKGIIADMFH